MNNYALKSAIMRAGNPDGIANNTISSSHATKDKFRNGWLSGVGSDSQFQSLNGLPVLPYRSNNDAEQRYLSSTGQCADNHMLLPSWRRSYAWNVGTGTDALVSNITWTSKEAGLHPNAGIAAPIVNAGEDHISTGPIAPYQNYTGGGIAVQAPVVLFGGEGAEEKAYEAAAAKAGARAGVNARNKMMLRGK